MQYLDYTKGMKPNNEKIFEIEKDILDQYCEIGYYKKTAEKWRTDYFKSLDEIVEAKNSIIRVAVTFFIVGFVFSFLIFK